MTGTDRSKYAIGGLVLGAVLLLAVNLLSTNALTGQRLDLTEDSLYTISDGTREVLSDLDEPLTARLYFSETLGERSPRHALYHDRIRELLERYEEISGGMLRVELIAPEPFSEAEDRAMAAGLQGVPVTSAGDLGYFGLQLAGPTDKDAVIPFFNLEREQFVEYDLTKLVYGLAHPDKKAIGLISPLPVDGDPEGPFGPKKRWVIMDQVREFFDVQVVPGDVTEIPDGIETLMVVHPKGLTDGALYAIDQFVMRGGNALVFIDPYADLEKLGDPTLAMVDPEDQDLNPILASWGVKLDAENVAGDIDAAKRVSTTGGDGRRPTMIDYVAWLGLDKDNFDPRDVITADIDNITLATAGILEKTEGASTEVTPLLFTGPKSQRIDSEKVRDDVDAVKLYREFEPSGEPLMLAARISGQAESAFPDGPPAPKSDQAGDGADGKPAETREGAMQAALAASHRKKSDGSVNVIVVADVDMLYDQFWVQVRDFFGQKVLVPTADNGDFVVNALDTLAGSDALVSLRGRGRSDRPFELVDDIRREAEQKFRAKEEELRQKLRDVKARLAELQTKRAEGDAIVTAEDKKAMDQFRAEMVRIRKELRQVQHALRSDIESLEAWLKFANIAGLPILLGVGTLAGWGYRRARRRKVLHRD